MKGRDIFFLVVGCLLGFALFLATGCAYNGTVNIGYRSAISERGNAETTIEGGGSPTLEVPLTK